MTPNSEVEVNLVSPLGIPAFQHGRTDIRTHEEPITAVYQETAVDAGARTKEDVTLGEVIAAGFMPTRERHPIIRLGERAEIPAHVRAAVWYRDHGRCDICPQDTQHDGPLHLDHIHPWSAGGPDTTDNLRLLCETHNMARSNFIDYERPKLPATWWCHRCYDDRDDQRWLTDRDGLPLCERHWYWPHKCRVNSGYRRQFAMTRAVPTWHDRPRLTRFHLIAFCAHCFKPGETGVVL